jgi:hypothetical protein
LKIKDLVQQKNGKESTKADVELAVAIVLNGVKLKKKATSQMMGLKQSLDLMIV